ncbi:MAG: CYTH domain-containing protein [Desulfuromonas sp.]|nr:CYTH domain-containing protein [Desulfuromonas sp.]
MKIEIERKFLLKNDTWRAGSAGILYRQGYLCTDPERTVRVRLGGDTAILAVKGAGDGIARAEFEYPIPTREAMALLDGLCLHPLVEKYRYRVPFAGLTWEIDEFLGANVGLLLAEVELEHVDQPVPLPPWIGREVTGDHRYYNAWLARHPFSTWPAEKQPGGQGHA